MTYRRLFLFVEGDDDERFFRSVLVPSLQSTYQHVEFVQFSHLTKKEVRGYLRSIAGMKADYIFVHDLDQLPCATAARNKLQVSAMLEILESYDRKTARRNESFRRFVRKFTTPLEPYA